MLGHQLSRNPNLEVSFKLPRAAAKDLWHLAKCGDTRLKDIGILKVQIRELRNVNPDEFLSWNGRRKDEHQRRFEDWSYNSLRNNNERNDIQNQHAEEFDYRDDIPAQWPRQHAPPHYTLYNSSQPPSQTLREKNEYRRRSGHVAEKEVHKTKIIGISRGVLTNESIPIVADFLGPTPGWLLESALCISFRRHGKCEVACQTGSEKIVYRPRPGSSRYEQSSRMEMAATELLSDIDGRYKVYSDKMASEKELCDELRPRKSTSKDGSFTQCSSESIRILESLANSLENANEKAGTGISGEYPTNQMYEQNIREPVFYEGQNDVVSRQPRGGYNPDQRYGSGMQVNLNAEIGHVERPAQYSEEEGLLLNIEKKNVGLHYVSENRGGRVNFYNASQAAEYRQGNSRQERDVMIERSDIRERDSFREETKDPAQVFGSGTLRDYLEREKEIYEASKKDFAIAAEKHQLQDYEFRRFLKIDPAKRPSAHKSCRDDSFKKMFSEDQEPKARDIDSSQVDNSEHSSNQMGYSGQSLPISVSLDGDYLKGIAARGKEGKDGTKRKRTRRVPSSSQDYVGEDEYLDDETYIPYQVKRKRGRPPKTGVPVEQPKKKRGRPPKIKLALTDAAEVPLETGGPGVDARRIGDYLSSADLRRMSSVSTDSQDLDGSLLGQGLTENGECLLQEAQRSRAAPRISYQGEVFDDKREYFVEEAKQVERSSWLPVTNILPTRANTDDLFVLDTAPAAQTKSAENQAITDRSMQQVISDEDVIELSSNEDHSAFSPVHMKGSSVPVMISPAAAMTAEGNHGNIFFRDQAKPIHVDTSEKGFGDKIMKTNITHSEESRRGSENFLASHVDATFQKTKEFPKEILSAPHLTPGTSRSSSPIDRTYQIDLDMKVRSRRHRWYQKDTVHRDIEEAYTRMYPSVACETEQLMPEDVYYGENYPIIFADDDKVMMKFVDMSTAFKLAMKESATKKQRSSSTELVVPTVSQKEGKKTSERRRSSVQSLTDIHESEDTKIEASVVAKMQKRRAVVIKKTSKPIPPAKRKSIEADSDSDFVTDKRRETHILDAESSEKPSHGMSLRPRRVLNLGEEYLSSDSFEEEYGPDADAASVYESDESSDSEPLINKVRKSSTSSATKFIRRTLSEKVDALSGESLKTFVDNAARQTTQHIETVLGNMPTGMPAKTSSESFARSLGPTGVCSKTPSGNFRKKLGPHSYVSHNLMQAVGSNTALKENSGNALGQGRSISHNLPQAGASDTSKQSLTHVPSTKLPGLSQSTQIRSREVKSSQRVELDETEQRSAETAVMTTPSNRDTFVISFDDLMASEAFSMCKEKRENEDSPQNDLAKASTEKSVGNVLYDSARDMIAKHKKEVSVDLTSDCSVENLSPVDKKEIVPKGDSGLKRDYLLETSSTLKTEENANDVSEERKAIHLKQEERLSKGDSGLKRDYLMKTSSTLKTGENTNEVLEERRAIDVKEEERLSPDNLTFEINNTKTRTRVRPNTGSKNTRYAKGENQRLKVSQNDDLYKDSALSVIKSDEIVVSQESLSNSSETFVVDMLRDEKEYAVKSRNEASKVMCEEIKLTNDPSNVCHERVTSELKIVGEIENHQPNVTSKSHSGKQKLVEDSGSKESVNVTVGEGLQGKAMKRNSQKGDETREDLPEVTSQSQGEKHKLKEGPGVPKKDVVTGDVLQGEAKKGRSQAATVTSKDRPEATPKSQGDKHKLEEDPGVPKKDVVAGDVLQGEAKKERSQAVTVTSKDRPEVTPQSQDEKHRLEKGPDVPKKDVIVVVEDILQGEAKKGKNQKGTAAGKEDSVFVEEEGSRKADEKVKEDSSYIASVKSENVCRTGSRIMTEKSEANSFEKSYDETVFQQTEELIRESANSDTSVIKDTSMLEDASLFEDTSVIKDPSMFKDTSLFEETSVIKDTSVVKDTAVGNATVTEKKPTEELNSMQHVSKDCAVGTIKVAETITSKEVMAVAETITSKEVMAVAETITSKEVMAVAETITSKEVMAVAETSTSKEVMAAAETSTSKEAIAETITSKEVMDSQDTEVKRKSNTVESIKSTTTNDLSSKEVMVIKDANSEAKDRETMLEKHDTEPFKNITDIASDQGTKGIMEDSATMSSETKLKDGGVTTGRKQGESKVVAVLAAEPAAPKKQNNKNTEENGGSKITNLIKRSIKAISDTLIRAKVPKFETGSMIFQKAQVKREIEDENNLRESEEKKDVAESGDKGKQGSQREEDVMLASNLPKVETDSMDVPKTQLERGGEVAKSLQESEGNKEIAEAVGKGKKGSQKEETVMLATDFKSLDGVKKEVRYSGNAQRSRAMEETDGEGSKPSTDDSKSSEMEHAPEIVSATDNGSIGSKNAGDESLSKAAASYQLETKDEQESILRLKSDVGKESLYSAEQITDTAVSEMLIADKAASITESSVPCSRATANESNQCPVTIADSEGSARIMKSVTTNMPDKLTESGDTKKHERCDELERQGSNLAENNSSAADLVADTGNVVPKPLASKVNNAASMKSKVSARQGSISTPSKRNENSSRQAVPQGSGSSPFAKDPLGTSHSPSDERHAEETDAAQGLRPSPSAKRHIEEMDAAQCLLGLFNSDQPSQSPTKTSGGMSTNLQQGESSGQEKNTRNAQVAVQESKPEIAKGTKGSILLIASERKISSRLGSAHRDIDKRPKFQSVTTSVSLDKNKAVMDHDYIADYSTCEIQQAAKLSPNSRSVSDRSDSTKSSGMFLPQAAHQKGKNPSKNSENQAKGSGSSPVADQKSLPASQTARNIFESFKFEQPSESVVQNDNVEIVSSKRDRSSSHTGSVLESTTSDHNIGKEATARDSRKKQEGTNSDKVKGHSSKTGADHSGQKMVVSKDNSKKLETAMADRCETKKRVVEDKSEKQEGTMSGKVEQQFDTDHSKVGGQKVVVSKDSRKNPDILKADSCKTEKKVVKVKSENQEGIISDVLEQRPSKVDSDHSKVGGQKVVVSKDSRKNPDILKADSCKTEKKVVEVKSENQGDTNSDALEQQPSKVDTDHSEIRGQKLFVSEVSAYKPEIVNADSGQAKKRVTETKLDQNSSEDAAQSGPGNIFENMGISGISGEKKEHCRDSKEKANTDAGKGGEKDVIRETISGIAGDIAIKKRQVSSGNAREEEFEDCHVTESLSTKHVERKQESPAEKILHDSKMQSHEEGTKLNDDRKSSDFGHGAQHSGQTDISRSGQTSPDRHKSGQTPVDAEISLNLDERLDVVPGSQSQKAALCDEITENADAGKVKGKSSETDKKCSDTVPLLVSDEVKDSDQHCNKKLEADACSFKVKEDVVCSEKLDDRASQMSETSKRIRRDLNQETASEATGFAPSAKVSKQEFLDESLDNNKTTEPLEPSEKEGCTPDCTTRRAKNEGQYCAEALEEISPVEQDSSSEKPDTCLASGPRNDPLEMMHEKQHKDKDIHQESDTTASSSKQRSGTSQGKGNSSNQESETKRRQREKKRKSADLELLDENRNVLTRGRRRHGGSPAKRLRSSRS